MTKPILTFTKTETGVYDDPVAAALEKKFRQRTQARDRWFWLKVAGYVAATVLTKAGAIAGFVVMSPVIVGMAIWRAFRNRNMRCST